MDTFEKRIKAARKKLGLTQSEFAQRAGITVRTFQRYEKDASVITIPIATKLAHSLEVDFFWLIAGDNADQGKTPLAFRDLSRGEAITKRLLELERMAPKVFDIVETYISGAHEAAKATATKWEEIEKKRPKDVPGFGKQQKEGTNDA